MRKRLAVLLTLIFTVATLAFSGCGAGSTDVNNSNSNADNTTDNQVATNDVISGTQSQLDTNNEGQIPGDPKANPAQLYMLDSTEERVTIRAAAMSGPTAMGMVKLMEDASNGKTACQYEFADIATEASAFVAPIAKGELDIACVPSNLAAKLYKNTEGQIVVLSTNTLGVLYVVSRDESIKTFADLKAKKIYATGAGAVPEYTIKALFKSNNMDAESDAELIFAADTTEALAYIKNDETAVAILPQPFATAACAQVEGLKMTLDLNDAWEAAGMDSNIVTGVVVARKEFVEKYPKATAAFLYEYKQSVNYANDNVSDTAALIEKYGIVAKAAIAEKALPKCHIAFKSGYEMKKALVGFYEALSEIDPTVTGGSLPGDDFYYGAD